MMTLLSLCIPMIEDSKMPTCNTSFVTYGSSFWPDALSDTTMTDVYDKVVQSKSARCECNVLTAEQWSSL